MSNVQQLEIHIVTHSLFKDYEWFEALSSQEVEVYNNFKRGTGCVFPNDEPYCIAAIVGDSHQTITKDILPTLKSIKKFMKMASMDEDTETDKTIKVRFAGFKPSPSMQEATITMLNHLVGMGFNYKLA